MSWIEPSDESDEQSSSWHILTSGEQSSAVCWGSSGKASIVSPDRRFHQLRLSLNHLYTRAWLINSIFWWRVNLLIIFKVGCRLTSTVFNLRLIVWLNLRSSSMEGLQLRSNARLNSSVWCFDFLSHRILFSVLFEVRRFCVNQHCNKVNQFKHSAKHKTHDIIPLPWRTQFKPKKWGNGALYRAI